MESARSPGVQLGPPSGSGAAVLDFGVALVSPFAPAGARGAGFQGFAGRARCAGVTVGRRLRFMSYSYNEPRGGKAILPASSCAEDHPMSKGPFPCPECRADIRVSAEMLVRQEALNCPACGTSFRLDPGTRARRADDLLAKFRTATQGLGKG
jgi:hypothetical protein